MAFQLETEQGSLRFPKFSLAINKGSELNSPCQIRREKDYKIIASFDSLTKQWVVAR